MSDYTPIDCSLYSEYELAIMQGTTFRLSWKDAEANIHVDRLTPFDLQTRDGAEYMLAVNGHGDEHRIRLDLILRAEPLPTEP